MNVITLEAFGGTEHFRLDKRLIPSPKHGEVRIRIKAAAFNPVDCKIRRGAYGGQTPIILGADCSGVIDGVGAGVERFAVGDEVYAMPFGQASNGSYAQYVCLPNQFVAKKPKNLSFEEAACIPLVSMTAYRATASLKTLNKKGSLFIAGAAGGVGCMAVQLARLIHKGPIYTIARNEETAKFLNEKLQIDKNNIVIYEGLSIDDLRQRLIELNHGNHFAGVFDFVGKEMKALCISLADYSGHVASIVSEDPNLDLSVWANGSPYFQRNLSLCCVFVGAEAYFGQPRTWEVYREQLTHITQLLESKAIGLPHYTSLGPLCVETVQRAHHLLESCRVKGKLVMQVD